MSYRRIGVEFYGNAAGYLSAANRVLYGTERMSQGLRSFNREGGLMQNQMKAIGTTARYYLAGQVVFGINAAISRLAAFKRGLGEIDSLAAQMENGHLQGFGKNLDDVGTNMLLTSNRIGIGVSDVEAYMTRFWSAFEPPPGMSQQQFMPEARGFTDVVSKVQQIFGTEAGNPQELAGAIAGYANQIPGGREHPAATAQHIAGLASMLTQKTPTITGRNIAMDIGRMGAAQVQANMTPEQLFAVWTVAGRAGGSASVIGRGLSQLLGTSLLRPQSPTQQQAYRSLGLSTDPSTLRSMGGMRVLSTMLDKIGGNKKLTAMAGLLGNEEIDTDQALAAADTTGVDLTKIYQVFGRQESARQFIALLAQGGVPALKEFIEQAKNADQVFKERYKLVEAQLGMQRIQAQWQNIGIGLTRGMEPMFTKVIGAPLKVIADTIDSHPTVTAGVVGAVALNATGRVLQKMGAFTKVNQRIGAAESIFGDALPAKWRFARGGMRLLTGMGNAQRAAMEAALMTEATPNVVAGGATDGSRSNPYWVIIHPYSNFVGVEGGYPGNRGGGGGSNIPPVVPFGGAGSALLRYGGPLAAGLAARQLANSKFGKRHHLDYSALDLGKDVFHGIFGGDKSQRSTLLEQASQRGPLAPWERPVKVHGEASITVTNKLVDKLGNVISTTKNQAPVKLWGAPTFPSQQGKPGTKKGQPET